MEDPDVDLMLRVRDGDHEAFRHLFEKHRAPLARFALRFVSDAGHAEEIVQDAFLQLYRARRRYEPRARFGTYLYRIVTNLCLNRLRRDHGEESLDAKTDAGLAFADDREILPDAYAAGAELGAQIEIWLAELPENQATVLALSRLEGYTHQEIADSLDTTIGAVKSLLFRGTRTLRAQMDGWGNP